MVAIFFATLKMEKSWTATVDGLKIKLFKTQIEIAAKAAVAVPWRYYRDFCGWLYVLFVFPFRVLLAFCRQSLKLADCKGVGAKGAKKKPTTTNLKLEHRLYLKGERGANVQQTQREFARWWTIWIFNKFNFFFTEFNEYLAGYVPQNTLSNNG